MYLLSHAILHSSNMSEYRKNKLFLENVHLKRKKHDLCRLNLAAFAWNVCFIFSETVWISPGRLILYLVLNFLDLEIFTLLPFWTFLSVPMSERRVFICFWMCSYQARFFGTFLLSALIFTLHSSALITADV